MTAEKIMEFGMIDDEDKDIDENDEIISESNQQCDDNKIAKVIHWNKFILLGNDEKTKQQLNVEMIKRIKSVKPGQCCTLIYTSGTTGPPKAVMISHDNLTWQSRAIFEHVKTFKKDGSPHASVSYLPLSHIAAQLADIWFPMGFCANYPQCKSWQIYFARPDALKGSLGLTLKAAKPTFFFGVPRVWEKIEEKIKKTASKNAPSIPQKILINWLKSVMLKSYFNKQVDGDMNIPWGHSLGQRILVKKVKNILGFDRLQVSYSGAAPISRETLEFWGSLGIPIIEVYGMSESCGIHTVSLPYYNCIGTVGVPLPGVTTLLQNEQSGDRKDKPGHGEICMRGRHIMMGYMYDEIKTKQVIDDEGYLHSGDIGIINDKYNILSITEKK
eukprot:182317_1